VHPKSQQYDDGSCDDLLMSESLRRVSSDLSRVQWMGPMLCFDIFGWLSDRKDIWPVGSNGDVCVYTCSVESTALHLIMGLGSWEVQPQLSRIIVEPKSVVLISNDSEELNRAMILTLARAVHVTGTRDTVFSFSDSVTHTHTPV